MASRPASELTINDRAASVPGLRASTLLRRNYRGHTIAQAETATFSTSPYSHYREQLIWRSLRAITRDLRISRGMNPPHQHSFSEGDAIIIPAPTIVGERRHSPLHDGLDPC